MDRVLVLLASYNGEPWIGEQIDSVLRQTDVDVSLLVSDDCSNDATTSVVKAYIENHDYISLIERSESSGSAGANFFKLVLDADVSGFDYVAFSDQDDVWLIDKLKRGISLLKERSADCYSSGVTAFWPDGKEVSFSQSPNIRKFDHIFEGAGQGCTFIITSAFFENVKKLISENYELITRAHYHDWTVYVLARALGKEWVFDQTPTMRYRQHAENDTGAKYSLAGIAKRFALIRSGWYAKQILAALDTAILVGGDEKDLRGLKEIIGSRGLINRFGLFNFVLKHGRRKRSDRFVLAFSALMGWLFI